MVLQTELVFDSNPRILPVTEQRFYFRHMHLDMIFFARIGGGAAYEV